MPAEIITLTPSSGAALSITGDLSIGMETDWGDVSIQAALATGPDVIGGIAGARQRVTRTVSLPVRISSTTASAYAAAAASLDTTVTALAYGGTLTRQVDFGGGHLSEALELTVLDASLHGSEGWMQAHRLYSTVVITLTCEPGWLAPEESLASVSSSTATLIELALPQGRGSLTGPGRVVITDKASKQRRFVELGGAFEQDLGSGQTYEFRATAFSLTGAVGSLVSDSAAITGQALALTPLMPAPQIAGFLNNLPHRGTYAVRLRCRGGSDDTQAQFRVAYRSAKGIWTEVGTVTAPDPNRYYDVEVGTIRRYDDADTIDIRVDVIGSQVDLAATGYIDLLTVVPAEIYGIARGVPVAQAAAGLAQYDTFDATSGNLCSGTNAADLGGTWAGSGSGTDFIAGPGFSTISRYGTNDSTATLKTGRFAFLPDSFTTLTTVMGASITHSGPLSTTGMVLRLFNYTATTDWAGVGFKVRRTATGNYRLATVLYKCVGGTLTALESLDATVAGQGQNILSVSQKFGSIAGCVGIILDSSGNYTLSIGKFQSPPDVSTVLASGTDTALVTGGKVGVYGLVQWTSTRGGVVVNDVHTFSGAPTPVDTAVVKSGGTGEITSESAFAADLDGSSPVPVSSYRGNRIQIPALPGRLLLKVRTDDSGAEPDKGAGQAVDVEVFRRASFSTISDTVS